MAPWMIIAVIGLIGLGLLLVAPRWHRRSLDRAGRRADTAQRARLRDLEDRTSVTTIDIADRVQAQSIQRQLLLRGVRAHLVDHDRATGLVFESQHADLVEEVRSATENP